MKFQSFRRGMRRRARTQSASQGGEIRNRRQTSSEAATRTKRPTSRPRSTRQLRSLKSSQLHPPCPACKAVRQVINHFLEGPVGIHFETFELGTVATLQRQSARCSFSRDIFKLCVRWLEANGLPKKSQDRVQLGQSYNSLGYPVPTRLTINIWDYREYPTLGPELNIIELNTSSPDARKPYGRPIDPHWIDSRLIREWIRCCDSWHAGHCHTLPDRQKLPWPRQIRLIDVERGCLVWGSEGDRYIALSYVWGTVSARSHQFHTARHNVEKYEQPGALSMTSEDISIPQTVRDAMRVVALVGEKYLWVDSLCIVQDEKETMGVQINQMGSIFANAYLTIIAAEGNNAEHGLRGIQGGSRSRDVSQSVLECGPGKKMLALITNMFEYVVWNHRGWTFQEKLFSQRKLIFSNGIARWMCHCVEWCEDVTPEASSGIGPGHCENLSSVGAFSLRFTLEPSFTEYTDIVEDYGCTELTYETDVLAAFSGITSALGRTFSGGFHFGLPEMYFDLALLWNARSPIERRSTSDRDSPNFPSWSWAGWKGPRTYMYLGWAVGCAREDEAAETSWDITPTVQWYKIGQDGGSKTILSKSWQFYRDTCGDSSQSLPEGWSRHRSKDASRTAPHQFTYISDPATLFRFPIPMNASFQEIESTQKFSPFLFCYTSRASLATGKLCLPHSLPEDQCMPVCLVDGDNQWAGILYLNIPCSEPIPSSIDCDLISISRGSARNDNDESFYFPEWDFEDRPKSTACYEFYNVLWVEWRDDVAYRRGQGRVLKGSWDAQDLEWLNVKLG